MERACSDAIRPGTCSTGPTEHAVRARVRWASQTIVDVEVDSPDGVRSARRVVFRPDDPESDRFQTIGLVVASMATGERSAAARAARPKLAAAHERNTVWVGLGGLLGNGLRSGPARYGGWLHAGYQVLHSPIFVSLGSGYAVSATDGNGVTPGWASFSFGAGAIVESKPLRLSVRPALELAMNRTEARLDAPSAHAAGSRWLPATQASFTLSWPARAPVAVVVGASGGFSTGATGVRTGGAEITSFPALSYAGLVGIELAFGN